MHDGTCTEQQYQRLDRNIEADKCPASPSLVAFCVWDIVGRHDLLSCRIRFGDDTVGLCSNNEMMESQTKNKEL